MHDLLSYIRTSDEDCKQRQHNKTRTAYTGHIAVQMRAVLHNKGVDSPDNALQRTLQVKTPPIIGYCLPLQQHTTAVYTTTCTHGTPLHKVQTIGSHKARRLLGGEA